MFIVIPVYAIVVYNGEGTSNGWLGGWVAGNDLNLYGSS